MSRPTKNKLRDPVFQHLLTPLSWGSYSLAFPVGSPGLRLLFSQAEVLSRPPLLHLLEIWASKEVIQMANKHRRRCTASFVIREM